MHSCSFHGWQTNHFGRVVLTLYGHYYVISRRYKCLHCEEIVQQKQAMALKAASQAVAAHGVTIEAVVDDTVTMADETITNAMTHNTEGAAANSDAQDIGHTNRDLGNDMPPYTFMGYNAKSRELLPDGLGNLFPAFFTHKGAVNMVLIDLMHPLFSVEVCPKQVSDILLELASKKYHHDYLRCEQDIK